MSTALGRPAMLGRRMRVEPGMVLLLAVLLGILVAFVIYPTWKVLAYPGVDDYLEVLSRPRWLTAARNSLVITLLSTTCATLLGAVFAFALTRRDIPLRGVFRFTSMLPLFAPPFMVAFAYILMFGRQGLISHQLLGFSPDIFGWKGLLLSQTIAFFPLATIIIKGVLEGIHPGLEQAALTLGATEGRALATVTVPLAAPGLIGAMLVIAITVLADFGNAVVIAGNYPLLATEAWFLLEGLAELKAAAVVVAALLVPTVALFVASRCWNARNSFVTVAGRGSDVDQIATPAALKWTVVAICSVACLLVVIVYIGIALAGLVAVWGNDWTPTLSHWREALNHGDAIWASLKMSFFAGLLTAVLAQVAAFIHSRNLPGSGIVDFLAVLPGALPGVFIGVGFVLAFNAPPLELAGTMWIIVFALGLWHLPTAYQATSAALSQIHKSIEDAARNLGASEVRLVNDVYAPMLMRSLAASFLQSFVRSVSNVSVVVFLVAPGNVVVTFVILQMIGGANWSGAAALTTLLLLVTFACVGVATLLAGRLTPAMRGVS